MDSSKKGKIIIPFLIIIIIGMAIFIALLLTGTIKLNNDNSSQKLENSNELSTNDVDKDKNYKQKKTISNSQLMDMYKNFIASLSGDSTYGIVDINGDGIYELITRTGTYEADYSYNFYSHDENISTDNFVFIGSIPAGHKVLYKMDDNTLMAVTGHMSIEAISYFYVDNAWLIRVPGKDSTRTVENVDDYKTGDQMVEFVKINDVSLFDKYR